MCSTAGPLSPNASTASSFSERAPARAPATSSTGPSAGRPSCARASARGTGRALAGIARPVTTYFGGSRPGNRIREEDALGERRRQPVREAEMRVGLGHRRRDPPARRGDDHRAGDVAASAEHRVRLAPREDPVAGRGRRERAQRGTGLLDAGPARQAADAKRVELEAGLRNQSRLGAIRRPGERHACSSASQRLADCERGQDVPRRPAGCDQECSLLPLLHCPRC